MAEIETYLTVKWSVSRGRETHGYNICTVTDQNTGKRYSCNGGGYDMLGTSFAEWLEDVHQAELVSIADKADHAYTDGVRTDPGLAPRESATLYGMTAYLHKDGSVHRVRLDGACGMSSMERIAKELGLTLKRTWAGRKNETTGYIVTSNV